MEFLTEYGVHLYVLVVLICALATYRCVTYTNLYEKDNVELVGWVLSLIWLPAIMIIVFILLLEVLNKILHFEIIKEK